MISGTGTPSPEPMTQSSPMQSGMSLIEVLVALFILAMASAAIMMTLPRQPSGLDREIARLEGTIDRLAGQAIASGEVHALRLTEAGYVAEAWRNDDWSPLRNSVHTLPASIRVSVAERPSASEPAKTWPDIVMDTTGIVTARDLVIRDGAGEYRLAVESDGAVSVER